MTRVIDQQAIAFDQQRAKARDFAQDLITISVEKFRDGVLAAMLCRWTGVAHAITLHVTDDTFTQQESPNAHPGSAASLSINNRNLTKEHITYALFDLALLPPTAAIDKAVLRFFSTRQ